MSPDFATALPMDGFHLTRAQLSAMPDPELAHARRGAEFTFDGHGFYELVKELRKPVTSAKTVWAPSFDHALKDPVEKGIEVGPEVRVVVFEGNCKFFSSFFLQTFPEMERGVKLTKGNK